MGLGPQAHGELFALRQAYQAYEFYQMQIGECDAALNDILCKINQDKDHREAGPTQTGAAP